ncbi:MULTISPECIES: purine-cytosine permease family protein [unclassified Streptomyces]|uniref:purine-cytosine permease family protein n=1 Tax=unclassified Streptomyces TaxID=2593676 RepID=UPI0011CD6CC3|nr:MULTISPECIES: cytosine permease [unclassified Streptomyces]TXS70757.1 cytosine permease [Streptomyces sp. me109]
MAVSRTSDRVGTVETRGIEPVPDDERHGNAGQMFWTWFAANISILGLPLGATLVAFRGLNIWQALAVAVVGSVGSFALVGVLSLAGKKGGAPALTLSRAVFGQRGNAGPTLITWLSRVGWETITTTTAAYALLALLNHVFGLRQNDVLTLVCLLVFIACTLLISGLGHATIMWINKWATVVFGVLNLVVIGFLVDTIDWADVVHAQAGPLSGVIAGIGFIAAGTGIGWANAGADYARYLPRSLPGRRLVTASAFGAGIPLVVLVSLGSLLSAGDTTLAESSNPVGAINSLLPSWMAVPYLIAAFGGLLMSNHLSTYSAGLTMITLGLRVPRPLAVGLDVLLMFLGGIYFMLVADDFYGPFSTFLTLLAVPISAWVGIVLVDSARGRDYDPDALMDRTRTSRYWYSAGFRVPAVLAWVVAIVVGLLFTEASTSADNVWFAGPLAHTWAGTNGLGWALAMAAGAAVYALGSRTRPADGPSAEADRSAQVREALR